MTRIPAWLSLVLLAAGVVRAQNVDTVLALNQTTERRMAGGQSHDYRFELQAGQYARVVVEQRTVNVAFEISRPDGKQVFAGDVTRNGYPEEAELVADATGTYRFRVTAAEATAPEGRYEITLRDVAVATEVHRHRVAAVHAFARASAFAEKQTHDDELHAIAAFEESIGHWRAAGDSVREAQTLQSMGFSYMGLGDRQKALDYTTRALQMEEAAHDELGQSWSLDTIGQVYDRFADKRKAVEYYTRALALARSAGDRAGEGGTLNHIAGAYQRLGEKRRALECLEPAIQIFRDLQDRSLQSTSLNNRGAAYDDLGEYQLALAQYEQSLALRREMKFYFGEAITLSNIGLIQLNLGEYQKALDFLGESLKVNRANNFRWNEGVSLNNIAKVYASLGDRERAQRFFQESTDILRSLKDQWGLAHTLNSLGEIYGDLGDYRKSLDLYNEALSCSRSVADPDMEAATLNNLGNGYSRTGELEKARDHFERALTIHRSAGNQRLLAGTLRNLGALLGTTGEYPRALEYLTEALKLSHDIQDRNGEAAALAALARVERARGNLTAARQRAEEALAAFESLRVRVMSPKLRASLFASIRELHELNIEVLARLSVQQPGKGYDAAALLASERSRARSLLEMISESGAEIRQGVDPALVGRERELDRLIAAGAERQVRLLSGKHTEAEAAASSKELAALATELEQVQSRIREDSPQYAALTQPAPLELKEIQSKVLDDETVLLEFSLGTAKSYLWAVTAASAELFELPGRAEIEAAARRVYDIVTARNLKPPRETPAARATRLRQTDEAYITAAGAASRMLLGPVASRIENKRLLIVAEGVLQYLPFGALPEPAGDPPSPLIVNHEVVTAPSASVFAVLRRQTAARRPAEKAIAVLADPVFSADDSRIALRTAPKAVAPGEASRAGSDPQQDFVRLRFSRNEAEEIARLAPPGGVLKALDFEASRATVLSPDFARYRIVHFATHSVLNNQHPELSGVVLSLVDGSGRPQNGFVRLYDIYNLRLGADLVVLSACQTALGGEIKGEGLIGLTRGFLYAGAPRVVASLWEIDDRTTAELMKHFYEGLLRGGARPAAALRAAQTAVWKTKGWQAPYYWGAFTLLGEWR